jgi:hypothetical protein
MAAEKTCRASRGSSSIGFCGKTQKTELQRLKPLFIGRPFRQG